MCFLRLKLMTPNLHYIGTPTPIYGSVANISVRNTNDILEIASEGSVGQSLTKTSSTSHASTNHGDLII